MIRIEQQALYKIKRWKMNAKLISLDKESPSNMIR